MKIQRPKLTDSLFMGFLNNKPVECKRLEVEEIDVEIYLKNTMYEIMPVCRLTYSEDSEKSQINVRVVSFYKGNNIYSAGTLSMYDIIYCNYPIDYLRAFIKVLYDGLIDEMHKIEIGKGNE